MKRGDKVTATCKNCGCIFRYTFHSIKRVFCSHRCTAAFHYKATRDPQLRPIYKRTCPVCGTPFETHIGIKKFCSKRCQEPRLSGRVLICRDCGATFQAKTNRAKYCPACRRKTKHRTTHSHICETCGKEFSSASVKSRFCSKHCRNLAWYSRRKEAQAKPASKPSFHINNDWDICRFCGHQCKGYMCPKCKKKWKEMYGTSYGETL